MTRRTRLPFRITLLVGLVLITTVWNGVRLFTAIAWSGTLKSYISAPLTLYVAATGAIWMALGCFVLWSFWRGSRHAGLIVLVAAGAYAAWAWLDRLLVQAGSQANWRFALLATIVLLGYVAAVVLDPHNRTYFRKETHDRKS